MNPTTHRHWSNYTTTTTDANLLHSLLGNISIDVDETCHPSTPIYPHHHNHHQTTAHSRKKQKAKTKSVDWPGGNDAATLTMVGPMAVNRVSLRDLSFRWWDESEGEREAQYDKRMKKKKKQVVPDWNKKLLFFFGSQLQCTSIYRCAL